MTQIFANADELERCHRSFTTRAPIAVTGVTLDGTVVTCLGAVQWIEIGHTAFRDYTLLVGMPDAP